MLSVSVSTQYTTHSATLSSLCLTVGCPVPSTWGRLVAEKHWKRPPPSDRTSGEGGNPSPHHILERKGELANTDSQGSPL